MANRFLKMVIIGLVIVFAGIGFLFSAVFVAMQFDMLHVRGSIDERNEFFLSTAIEYTAESQSNPDSIFSTGVENRPGVGRVSPVAAVDYSCSEMYDICNWNKTREWMVVAGGLSKDAEIIAQISVQTNVPSRLIAAVVVSEQIRFFTSNREVFKRYFEPLKILGSLSKFSLGVSGIKQDTAVKIEEYASDPESEFYPGGGYGDLLAYETYDDRNAELFGRLTNEDDHYYSYLYTAIFIKEITEQWKRNGYNVERNPDIIATIFNLGFNRSIPKSDPIVGGSTIAVGGKKYLYGELTGIFYSSEELRALFP